MSEVSVLTAEVRERVGKGAARALRRENKIPAVIYGDKKPPVSIILPYKEMWMKLHAGGFLNHVVDIVVGGEKIRAIPRDYQLDRVRDTLIHIDFLRVAQGARLTVEVPVHLINEEQSPGLKARGVLTIAAHSVELEAPADAIPEFVTVDLGTLDIGDNVHLGQIALPAGVTAVDPETAILSIAGPNVPDAEPAAEAAAPAPAAAPETK